MKTLTSEFRALVIGSSGAIGAAFVSLLREDPACIEVVEVSRGTHPNFALESEESMSVISASLKLQGPFSLIIDATGALTIDRNGPEKHLGALNADRLMRSFQINAIGPALLLKHFLPLLAPGRSIYAKLSARVGSISDNKKGGWYGYRASKAALNMLLQTAAIELARKNPDAVIAALQPGTVQSSLSKPFVDQGSLLTPQESAKGMLQALDQLGTAVLEHKGAFFIDYQGKEIPW
jgi:NAD(P)-dependent dehydrogenase (short-subunit alcohol dehydrogenase family)